MLRTLVVGVAGLLLGAAIAGQAADPEAGPRVCKKWSVISTWANGPDWKVDFPGAEPFAVATVGGSTRVFARACAD